MQAGGATGAQSAGLYSWVSWIPGVPQATEFVSSFIWSAIKSGPLSVKVDEIPAEVMSGIQSLLPDVNDIKIAQLLCRTSTLFPPQDEEAENPFISLFRGTDESKRADLFNALLDLVNSAKTAGAAEDLNRVCIFFHKKGSGGRWKLLIDYLVASQKNSRKVDKGRDFTLFLKLLANCCQHQPDSMEKEDLRPFDNFQMLSTYRELLDRETVWIVKFGVLEDLAQILFLGKGSFDRLIEWVGAINKLPDDTIEWLKSEGRGGEESKALCSFFLIDNSELIQRIAKLIFSIEGDLRQTAVGGLKVCLKDPSNLASKLEAYESNLIMEREKADVEAYKKTFGDAVVSDNEAKKVVSSFRLVSTEVNLLPNTLIALKDLTPEQRAKFHQGYSNVHLALDDAALFTEVFKTNIDGFYIEALLALVDSDFVKTKTTFATVLSSDPNSDIYKVIEFFFGCESRTLWVEVLRAIESYQGDQNREVVLRLLASALPKLSQKSFESLKAGRKRADLIPDHTKLSELVEGHDLQLDLVYFLLSLHKPEERESEILTFLICCLSLYGDKNKGEIIEQLKTNSNLEGAAFAGSKLSLSFLDKALLLIKGESVNVTMIGQLIKLGTSLGPNTSFKVGLTWELVEQLELFVESLDKDKNWSAEIRTQVERLESKNSIVQCDYLKKLVDRMKTLPIEVKRLILLDERAATLFQMGEAEMAERLNAMKLAVEKFERDSATWAPRLLFSSESNFKSHRAELWGALKPK